jgi:hypothetical protein
MKAANQKAILKILERDIRTTSISGSHYNDEAEIVKTMTGYVLKVSRPIITRDKTVLMEITPQQILKWSEEFDGDYFKAYTEAIHAEFIKELHRKSEED